MESPIDVVLRFCAAWSADVGADDLAALVTDDEVYRNIRSSPPAGRTSPTWCKSPTRI